ncbi:hypothetical protein [Nitrosovibrio sp. Nv17]|uniref:hypothetical protein n=1 Tax=Nitrosovibrio sp. Nv17 TaxID=1855339 RepID=UPI001160BA10|nr:hypothetical protein [Nitrosovibrio sp. Nv17]
MLIQHFLPGKICTMPNIGRGSDALNYQAIFMPCIQLQLKSAAVVTFNRERADFSSHEAVFHREKSVRMSLKGDTQTATIQKRRDGRTGVAEKGRLETL